MPSTLRTLLVILLSIASIQAEEPPTLVGTFADFSNFEFRGNDSFPDDILRESLADDLQLIPARRPDRSFRALCDEISKELTRGYLQHGFADIYIETGWDAEKNQAVITIVEGQQFDNGEVVVGGVNEEIRDSIHRWVTNSMPPLDAISDLPLGSKDESKLIWRDENGKLVDVGKTSVGSKISRVRFYQQLWSGFVPTLNEPSRITATSLRSSR